MFIDSVCIELLDGNKITSNKMLLCKIITLSYKDITIDLIVFDMLDFNMILGMDFLSRFGAKIDY